jgi:hypothetical protein
VKYVLATHKNNWGEDRVMYYDTKGKLRSIPASWTSLDQQDLFARTARGRSRFRADDLLRLYAQCRFLVNRRLGVGSFCVGTWTCLKGCAR